MYIYQFKHIYIYIIIYIKHIYLNINICIYIYLYIYMSMHMISYPMVIFATENKKLQMITKESSATYSFFLSPSLSYYRALPPSHYSL